MALSWTMDKIGPICRSVEDCALVFNAIYGTDGRDDTVVDAPFAWTPDVALSKLRIGYIAREFQGSLANPNASPKLLKDALDVFTAAGAKLEPIEMPDFPTDAINFILAAEAAAAFDDLTRSKGIDQLTEQTPTSWPNTFRTSRFIPAVEYIRAQRARTLLIRKMDALMATCDVFLAPARGSASLPLTNLTGHPAVCLKNGFVDGMPQALMITGRLYDEATLLRVALAYEKKTKWGSMHPSMDKL
jgi:Asp-tRNA(Asn)/Glu-tRNA(Gln) amidotransferase A subunit family amidase